MKKDQAAKEEFATPSSLAEGYPLSATQLYRASPAEAASASRHTPLCQRREDESTSTLNQASEFVMTPKTHQLNDEQSMKHGFSTSTLQTSNKMNITIEKPHVTPLKDNQTGVLGNPIPRHLQRE